MAVIYLTGSTSLEDEPALAAAGIGLMVQPGNSYHLRVEHYPWWAADNGCFAARWQEDTHLAWLDALPRLRCLFAVAPDVYPDAAESLARGLRYAPLIRDMGFPVAVVAQDGAEHLDWPWDELDALFLGGERKPDPRDEWKLSAGAALLVRRARAAGKWVHMGRVNSLSRLRYASSIGCLSADGTARKWRRRQRAADDCGDRDRRGAPELGAWQAHVNAHRSFPMEAPSLPVHREAMPS